MIQHTRLTLLAAAVAAACSPSVAQSIDAAPRQVSALPLGYVGTDSRIGVTIDARGKIQGEVLSVLGHDGQRAFVLEGRLGERRHAGLQAGYHWLWGGPTVQDTIDRPNEVTVAKVFGAADRNALGDRKLTLGASMERPTYGLDAYVSKALSDARQIGRTTTTTFDTVLGTEDGRPYRQVFTNVSLIEEFDQPYEHGVGLRWSRFLEERLLRLRAGVDFELGRALLEGRKATQLALTLGADKHFQGSGHSLSLSVEHVRKQGPFDEPRFGGKSADTRAFLSWRYEIGSAYRPLLGVRERQMTRIVEEPVPPAPLPPPPPPPPPRIERTEVQLSSAALFEFNKSEISDKARKDLQPLVQRIRRQLVGTITVVGHTCDLGSNAFNQSLSERRAAAVRSWLISEGVPESAIVSSGRGETEPAVPNDSEDHRARNRRVVLGFSMIEERVVPQEPVVLPPPPAPPATRTVTEVVRESVPLAAPWIDRALRTPSDHKRTVDTYRAVRVTQTRTAGAREFLNRAPVAADDQAVVNAGQPVTINVLANDSDPDGDALTVTIATAPTRGTASVSSGGIITYTPGTGFVDSDTLRYTVTDSRGLSATATVTLTRAANRAPVAADDQAVVNAGQPVTINVLANDSDPDGDPLTVTIATAPTRGTASVGTGGVVTYSPGATFAGSDTLRYTATDSRGLSATATVTITGAANRPPVARDDVVGITTDDGPAVIDVLANDNDPDGDALTVTITRQPQEGSASVTANNRIVYTPVPGGGSLLTVTIEYMVRDPSGLSATATLTVNLGTGPS